MNFRSWDCELGKIQGFWEPISKNEQKLKFPPKNGHEWPPPTPMDPLVATFDGYVNQLFFTI